VPVEGPTLVRRQLGRRLRALREAARKTAADVEYVASRSKLWRIEEGKSPVRVADARELARIYARTTRRSTRSPRWRSAPPAGAGGRTSATSCRTTCGSTSTWRPAPTR
jgi:transcriptional regulator with XRE-family HTH domain